MIIYPLLQNYIFSCKNLIDNFKKKRDYFFLENFFDSNEKKIERKVCDQFVNDFNNIILQLHIIAKNNLKIFIPLSPLECEREQSCPYCFEKDFCINEFMSQCNNCGLNIRIPSAFLWGDVSRVHATPVYSYDKTNHFKECILHFQGKNCTNQIVINIIIDKMTKIEFLSFLKKNYNIKNVNEQVHSLYYNTFNITPPDLTLIENNLIQDYSQFTKLITKDYEKSKTKNLATINNNFLLYQFLNRYGFKTSKDDVLLNDSNDTIPYRTCKKIFKMLNWQIYQ